MTPPIPLVPTQADIDAAHQAKLDAWLTYIVSDVAESEDRWSDYMLAIERSNDLEHQRTQAMLSEVVDPNGWPTENQRYGVPEGE